MERYRALVEQQRVSVDLAENQLSPRIDLSVGTSVDLGSGTAVEQDVLGTPVVEGSVLVSFPFQLREARGGIARTRAELGATELFIVNLREQNAAAARAILVDARAVLQIAHAQWRAATARPASS
jgi:hypothetical protein